MLFSIMAIGYVLAATIMLVLYARNKLQQDVTRIVWEKCIRDGMNDSFDADNAIDEWQFYSGVVQEMRTIENTVTKARLREVYDALNARESAEGDAWNAKKKYLISIAAYMHAFAPGVTRHIEEYIEKVMYNLPYQKYISLEIGARFLELMFFLGIVLFAPGILALSVSVNQIIMVYVGVAIVRDALWSLMEGVPVANTIADCQNNYAPLIGGSLLLILAYNPIVPCVHVVCALLTSVAMMHLWSALTHDDRTAGRDLRWDESGQQFSVMPGLIQKRYFCMLPMVYVYVLFPVHVSLLICCMRLVIMGVVGIASMRYYDHVNMPAYFDVCFNMVAHIYTYCKNSVEKVEPVNFRGKKGTPSQVMQEQPQAVSGIFVASNRVAIEDAELTERAMQP